MTFDTFESTGLDTVKYDLGGKMSALSSGFESSISSTYDAYMDIPESIDKNISHWLGDAPDVEVDLSALRADVMSSTKEMYNGMTYEDGTKSLGLKDIGEWKINKDYESQNIKQHSGYAAEVIGTTKENLIANLVKSSADYLKGPSSIMAQKTFDVFAKYNLGLIHFADSY